MRGGRLAQMIDHHLSSISCNQGSGWQEVINHLGNHPSPGARVGVDFTYNLHNSETEHRIIPKSKIHKFGFFDFFFMKFFFSFFFLVNFIKISDFLDSFCSNMSYYKNWFFHPMKGEGLGLSMTKSYWKDNYYIITYK